MVKSAKVDRTLAALADPTRRSILERLASGPATVTELAEPHGISLPGTLKHIRILEEARLVSTVKEGRTRTCQLAPAGLDDVTRWIEDYRTRWQRRLDRLETVLERTKEGMAP
jgi:DNA-binding transcriptional ArsR family regulator